jgi:hypothetical protein
MRTVPLSLLLLLLTLTACPGGANVTATTPISETTTGESEGMTSTSSESSTTYVTEGLPSYCSDTILQEWEQCEAPFSDDYGGCRETCFLNGYCGDGAIDEGHEVCDGGEGCPLDCGVAACKSMEGV